MTDPNDPGLPARLPPGAQLQRVAFAAGPPAGRAVLLEFPPPLCRVAVLADGSGDEELLVLSLPAPAEEDADLLERARAWADTAGLSQVVTLQGAHLAWAPGRVAVLAPAERLDAVRRVAVETCFYDLELRDIERELGALWPELEADAPLAFEFDERSVRRRRKLAQRFQRVLLLRARLARVTPHVLCPHVHPPTLASQVGERLRERARMAHRVDSLDGQLEVFERVYGGCGDRASDFMLARTSVTLEWVIILLLLTQTILVAVELLTTGRR